MLYDWECGVEWGEKDGLFTDDGRHWGVPNVNVVPEADYSRFGRIMFKDQVILNNFNMREQISTQKLQTCIVRIVKQEQLVQHYKFQREAGDIQWL